MIFDIEEARATLPGLSLSTVVFSECFKLYNQYASNFKDEKLLMYKTSKRNEIELPFLAM